MADTDIVQEFESVLSRMREAFSSAFDNARTEHELREQNARFVGPQGDLTQLMKRMREVPGDRKKELGQKTNALKSAIDAAFDARLVALARALREAELTGPFIDATLPG
ncbi:MAG: hypothetical protein RL385_4209, partial [Pseudomonadota bacterium]